MSKWRRKRTVLWPAVRDLLFNFKAQHDPHLAQLAFQLAHECDHPDARWLLSLFPEGPPKTSYELLELLRQRMRTFRTAPLAENEPREQEELRSAFWAAAIEWYSDLCPLSGIEKVAWLGYGPALGWMVFNVREFLDSDEERVAWAEKAASQNDCYGLYALAKCRMEGLGCKQDREGGLQLMRQAAELGVGDALFEYGKECYGEGDWQRYHWWARAAMAYHHEALTSVAEEIGLQLNLLAEHQESSRILFEIGAVLTVEGLEEMQSAELFYGPLAPPLLGAARLYDECCTAAERAIHCWIWVARQGIMRKDICKVICKLLWANRIAWNQPRSESKSRIKKVKAGK